MIVDINYIKAWRAKNRVIEILRGGLVDGYRRMPKYIHMLKTVYPNSYIIMHKSSKNKFMYLFIVLHLIIWGFEFCRPVVIVAAANLSGASIEYLF